MTHARDCAYVVNDGPAPCTCDYWQRSEAELVAKGRLPRRWFPHRDFAGEHMREGQFREPWPMDEETLPPATEKAER